MHLGVINGIWVIVFIQVIFLVGIDYMFKWFKKHKIATIVTGIAGVLAGIAEALFDISKLF